MERDLINNALAHFLYPIVAMMLRNGVTYKEFVAHSKRAFVAVAQRDFGIRGRPTNTSRVSAMTGIDRKEVKQVKDMLAGILSVNESTEAQDKMSRVLRAWHSDTDFLDDNQKPKVISLESGNDSFKELARRYSSGLTMNVVLKELMAAECVEITEEGKVKVVKPYYAPPGANLESLLNASTIVNDLASTLVHNLYIAPSNKKVAPHFQRRLLSTIDKSDLEAFKAHVDVAGQDFLECVIAWLESNTKSPKNSKNPVRVGLGAYTFERISEDNS